MGSQLLKAIEDKTANLVVLGLGYVGLPVACMFAQAGFSVVGLERQLDKVDKINHGECPIESNEPGLPEMLQQVVREGKLRATSNYQVCQQAQIVLISVETPVDLLSKKPNYQALTVALTQLGQNLAPGSMVIVESTLAPGTTSQVIKPILEENSGLRVNKDFYLVHCPERVMIGKLLANIKNCHRTVGGFNAQATELAIHFYQHIVRADLDPVDCLTAELVKTMENAYRDVQIAFANEMSMLCEDIGADVWQIRELVNKSPYRQMHLPGSGMGGHCIPKDPWLLIANTSVGFEPRMILAARAVNDQMPLHTAKITMRALTEADVPIAQAKVLVLGFAYLENSGDTRNSFSEVMINYLRLQGVMVVVHDPWVPEFQGHLLERATGCDAVVVMVKHQEYYHIDLKVLVQVLRTPLLIDGRNVIDPTKAHVAGLIYHSLGRGNNKVDSEVSTLAPHLSLLPIQVA